MLPTSSELMMGLGARIQARRAAMGITQAEAAERSGVSYSTWRRLETQGKASIEDLARAAILLRCDHQLAELFPPPAAASMDDLLKQQKRERPAPLRRRARARSAT
ncbi:helix-turn-helix domain-containing protein [Sphingomonas sanguinis]|jgi:transcriptional regulator with XRE-family HTH domain|uniref:Helix-turn-helix transcriptional regulator n=1 Tax=Sphingomonas sanguinis TaxID=33051 RepID=A0A7Y7UPF0_9SPHN|nr:helix-turn-helix transcriptional regulator [Sphingomonas sanguinis]MBZ6380501.1 helix-turn-helix domain-containing protein [Sphingomonas sanguinis]NNG51594.1 helix-turn-helix transcriptional regulator [Sphingomonas sanguinis]NNG52377.1 helix-turn-helix transcriptional regulator [Sphingomonas sanguinis]NVP29804.1 helix-turn-helix transcriptional regulator [Sphingomonas sanguinis]